MISDREAHSHADRWIWLAAIILSAFVLVVSIYVGSRRLLWFDELCGVFFARLPTVSAIWSALHGGADLQPLPFYLILRASESLFGRGEFAVRLPSAIGVFIGLLIVFDCVRRSTSGLYGLTAQALLMCSFVMVYAYEARPYGILFFCSSLLLWAWIHLPDNRKSSALAVGAIMFVFGSMHVFSCLGLIPYVVYDLLTFRRPSRKLVFAVAGEALALAFLSPLILVGRQVTALSTWWTRPTFYMLHDVYDRFFPEGLFLVAAIVFLAAVLTGRKLAPVEPMPNPERLGWLFLLIPGVGLAAAMLVTHSFHERYFIATLPGVAVAAASLIRRYFGRERWLAPAILIVFAASGIHREISAATLVDSVRLSGKTSRIIAMENALQTDGRTYTAVADVEQHLLSSWYYSHHPERYAAITGPGSLCWRLQTLLPSLQCWTRDDLERNANQTAIVDSLDTVDELRSRGFRITARQADPLMVFYPEGSPKR